MSKPSFINLWNGYPKENDPCDGPWNNQCAIRMSIALNAEMSIKVKKVHIRNQNVPMAMRGALNHWPIGFGSII